MNLYDKAKCTCKYARGQCEDLQHEIIEQPKTIVAAYYAKFQKLSYDLDSGTIEDKIPISLLIRASKKDDMIWTEAGAFGQFELFKAAAHEEISSLEKKGSWDVVKKSSVKGNTLPSTWALMRKRYPDGKIRKYKARFCVRWDMQWYGLDYEETYAPVFQWSTVRMRLSLAVKLGMWTKQVCSGRHQWRCVLRIADRVFFGRWRKVKLCFEIEEEPLWA